MAAMLPLVVCYLCLAAPAQMHVIETIFEQGISGVRDSSVNDTEQLSPGTCFRKLAFPYKLSDRGIKVNQDLFSSTRVFTIPAGTCNTTLYPSNLVCTDDQPYPYWLQIRVVDIKMAETSVSQDLLEVRVVRRGLQLYSATGECFAPATVSLAATCGDKILTSFDKWQFTPVQVYHGPRIEYR